MMKKAIAVILVVVLCALTIAALADETTVYVTASKLNGRAEPTTKANSEAKFYRGDELTALGYAVGWVEVVGGETGTVWCKAEHLAESTETRRYENTSGARARVHKELGGGEEDRVRWISAGKQAETTRTLLGWGYVGDGWIDLSCFSEVAE